MLDKRRVLNRSQRICHDGQLIRYQPQHSMNEPQSLNRWVLPRPPPKTQLPPDRIAKPPNPRPTPPAHIRQRLNLMNRASTERVVRKGGLNVACEHFLIVTVSGGRCRGAA
jgi:hypothetical protein